MGVQDDIEARLADKPVTKIVGQPTDHDITKLKRELTKIASGVPTKLGGGKHSHVGLVIKETDYIAFSEGGATFDVPSHPGHYPATVSTTASTRAS